MRLETVQDYIVRKKRTIVAIVAVLIACYLLYWFSLGSLQPNFAAQEISTRASALSLSNILNNPLNAPYNFANYLFLHVGYHSSFWNRAASASLATLASVTFFFIVKRWHGKQVAILSTPLFASTGWLLHVGRLDSPAITLLILPILLFWLANKFKHCSMYFDALTIGASVIASLLLYTPGAIYFVAMATIWGWPHIKTVIRQSKTSSITVALILPAVVLISLAIAMLKHHDLANSWLGFSSLPNSIVGFLGNWADSMIYLFAHGPNQPVYWLGRLPILDIFSIAMVLLATIYYIQSRYNHVWRIKFLLSFVLIASLLVAVGNSLYVSALAPIAYLLVASGIAYLLSRWYKVFPNNSLARTGGLALLSLAIAVAITYHVTSYFIAWNHNNAVVALFRNKL